MSVNNVDAFLRLVHALTCQVVDDSVGVTLIMPLWAIVLQFVLRSVEATKGRALEVSSERVRAGRLAYLELQGTFCVRVG